MLAVERHTSLILTCNDSLDGRDVALAESIVLCAPETFSPASRFSGLDPNVHNATTYESFHLGRPIPAMKQQPVHAMGAVIDDQLFDGHLGVLLLVIDLAHRAPAFFCFSGPLVT